MDNVLKKELETYYEHKEELIKLHNGGYVLIKGNKIINTFDTQKDAIKIGIDKFGNTPFLVKKIEEIESVQNYTSNLIITAKCHQ